MSYGGEEYNTNKSSLVPLSRFIQRPAILYKMINFTIYHDEK